MDHVKAFLAEREKNNLLRTLRPADSRENGLIYFDRKPYIDFSSNDYLGLSHHPKLKEAAITALEKFGASASASRLLSGDSCLFHQLEKKTADFKAKEGALIFNSGYQANVGIISSLYKKGDAIFFDKLSHASIIDGIFLSGARFFNFRHNDLNHLELLLKKERNKFKNSLMVTETVFSMDGDRAPLKALVGLKDKYNCALMVDEAHSTGIFGKNGSGAVEEEGLSESVDLIMGTFSKALGSFGAYLVCSQKLKQYLINTCRGFIYSTALPPSTVAANLAALEIIKKEPLRRKTLLENTAYFRGQLARRGFALKGTTQIAPLIIGPADAAVKLSQALQKKGFWVQPIRPPTVPRNESRLRFSLTFNHSRETLDRLIAALKETVV